VTEQTRKLQHCLATLVAAAPLLATTLLAITPSHAAVAREATASTHAAPPARRHPAQQDTVVGETVDAINTTTRFWDWYMPRFTGSQFRRPGLGAWGYGRNSIYNRDTTVLKCGTSTLGKNNAYACTGGTNNWVAFEVHLMNKAARLGDAFIWVIVAHEYAHVVQRQLASRYLSQAYELQADCFAGATMGEMYRRGMLILERGDYQEIDDSLAEIATLPWGGGGTHGSVAQRWSAFGTGWRGGNPSCLNYVPIPG
jgi:predicted metalloprotease